MVKPSVLGLLVLPLIGNEIILRQWLSAASSFIESPLFRRQARVAGRMAPLDFF